MDPTCKRTTSFHSVGRGSPLYVVSRSGQLARSASRTWSPFSKFGPKFRAVVPDLSSRWSRILPAVEQFLLTLAAPAIDESLVKHHAFFQFADGSPERSLQSFGVLLAKVLW